MAGNQITEQVKNFVFEYVDSVEALEILLFFHSDPSRSWSVPALASELRSNPNSAQSRMKIWQTLNIVCEKSSAPGEYYYCPNNPAIEAVVLELANHYRIQRYKIFELIFSPLKKARDFADAFRKPDPKDGKKDG